MTLPSSGLAPLTVRHEQRAWTVQPGDSLLIGRSTECQITIADPRISRKHMRLAAVDGTWALRCTGSNGTYVQEQRLPEVVSLTGPLTVRLGDPSDGPILSFAVERQPTLAFGPASPPAAAAR